MIIGSSSPAHEGNLEAPRSASARSSQPEQRNLIYNFGSQGELCVLVLGSQLLRVFRQASASRRTRTSAKSKSKSQKLPAPFICWRARAATLEPRSATTESSLWT